MHTLMVAAVRSACTLHAVLCDTHNMANPTQPGIEVIKKEFKRDGNDNILCTDRVEVKVNGDTLQTTVKLRKCFQQNLTHTPAPLISVLC